jgi:transposase
MKTLLANASTLRLEKIVPQSNLITVVIKTSQSAALCPKCQHPSTKVHSRYQRQIADLPWEGIAVRLLLLSRKFFCTQPLCPRRIFCERLPDVVAPYARRTLRLNEALAVIGFAIGGRAGARAGSKLGFRASAKTLLRRVRQATLPQLTQVKVLGVDDWAKRKGQSYGTILVDLERRRPIELLADREATTLAAWLAQHPGIEVISRDRAGAYADGARQGAPAAMQVADRFHLLKNISEVFERVLNRHHTVLRKAMKNVSVLSEKLQPVAQITQDTTTQQPANGDYFITVQAETYSHQQSHQQRKARYEAVKTLQREGLNINEIRKLLGIHHSTAARFFHADCYPEMVRGPRGSKVDRFDAYVCGRWAAGCRDAKQLHEELCEQGYRGSARTIRRYVQSWRKWHSATVEQVKRSILPVPTPRQITWMMLKPTEKLEEQQRQLVEEVLKLSPAIKQGLTLVEEFRCLVRERQAEGLTQWMERAATSGLVEVENFVKGLKRDEAAVRAALSSAWSNGQVEGQINRLKYIKRQMFGRANFDLLRARVLYET